MRSSQSDEDAKPSWRRRWAMIRAVLWFCAAMVVYIVIFGPDDGVRETALIAVSSLAGAVALGYLGFATQDDGNWLSRRLAPQTSERPR